MPYGEEKMPMGSVIRDGARVSLGPLRIGRGSQAINFGFRRNGPIFYCNRRITVKLNLPLLFWFEAGLAAISGVLTALTLSWPIWIEVIFKVDPDADSGAAEWAITLALMIFTVALTLAARASWRRAPA
jgi:hypothetical protein